MKRKVYSTKLNMVNDEVTGRNARICLFRFWSLLKISIMKNKGCIFLPVLRRSELPMDDFGRSRFFNWI